MELVILTLADFAPAPGGLNVTPIVQVAPAASGAEQLLLVQAGERLDVYEPGGSLVRSLDLPGLHTRMQIEPVR